MADIKISTLTAGTTLGGTEAIPAVQSAVTVKITPAQIKTYVGAAEKANNLSDLASATTARTNLGLAIGTNVQAYDADLAAIAGLTYTADSIPYFTAAGAASLTTLTSFGRSLIDDTSATNARTTLGLGTAATQNTGTSGANVPLLNGANTFSGATTVSGARLSVTGSGGFFSIGAEQAATIVSDAVTITGSNMVIDTEAGAASDNLATINAASPAAGDIIAIRSTADARDIIVKHGTGNIKLNGSADLTLTTRYAVLYLMRTADGWWIELGRSIP